MQQLTVKDQTVSPGSHQYILLNTKMGAYQVFNSKNIHFDDVDLDRLYKAGHFRWVDQHTYWCLACAI